jgi:4-hydroxybenzoate polyprenyltransferase/phosphoserine phosphatase
MSISTKNASFAQIGIFNRDVHCRLESIMTEAPMNDKHLGTASARPLVVDLDGTLVRSDLLIETAFAALGRDPLSVFDMIRALVRGKAPLKHYVANLGEFDPTLLPYDEVVVSLIRKASSEGRATYLVSASNERLVRAVVEHLGLFTGWFASEEANNLSGKAKAERLVREFGEHGFDYIGNAAPDLAVWARAAKAIAIRIPRGVARRLSQAGIDVEYLPAERPTWKTWVKLLRVHQYSKNALIFVPLLTSHQFSIDSVTKACLAFVTFSACASCVYIVNDLADLSADRAHPTKRFRPLASGSIPLTQAISIAGLLFMASILTASSVSAALLGVLLCYFCLTTAYSFVLKRKMLVDVVALAMLYIIRVIAGAVAIEVAVSEWLLAFSMFIFVSLALIKRYVELAGRTDSGLSDPQNRNYKLGDLEVVAALAAASGFNAVTVFALYISSSTVHEIYRHPGFLWLICPVLLYWISRALMMAHRRHMDDDPIAFALRDKNSMLAAAVIALLLLAAT